MLPINNIVNENIIVEFPHGAGGAFLSSVLACCTKNLLWQPHKTNFHKSLYKVKSNHWYEPANNIISIDYPGARYNFWVYYFKKRVIHELVSYRYQNRRWIKCPYQELDPISDGFWLLNQCRFIIGYQTQQSWKIDWAQMLQDPSVSWKTIQDFLNSNNQYNYWNLDKWKFAVDLYKQTLPKKISINRYHVRWQLWATALLQEQEIIPDFDLVNNFRTKVFYEWLDKYQLDLVETTKKCIWPLG